MIANKIKKFIIKHLTSITKCSLKFEIMRRTIKDIKSKLKNHDATIMKADKRNIIVILPNLDYINKVQDFFVNYNI